MQNSISQRCGLLASYVALYLSDVATQSTNTLRIVDIPDSQSVIGASTDNSTLVLSIRDDHNPLGTATAHVSKSMYPFPVGYLCSMCTNDRSLAHLNCICVPFKNSYTCTSNGIPYTECTVHTATDQPITILPTAISARAGVVEKLTESTLTQTTSAVCPSNTRSIVPEFGSQIRNVRSLQTTVRMENANL